MANGIAENGTPWYIKFIYQIGVPSAIALYLVYLLGSSLTSSTRDTLTMMQQHMGQAAELGHKIEQEQAATDTLIQLQKFTCLHAAHNVMERTDCYEASKK
jgi:hypothetical protein